MNNDYVPMGWDAEEYKTAESYNPHGLNDNKLDHMVKAAQVPAIYAKGDPLDFGESYAYDYRLQNNEVIHGD